MPSRVSICAGVVALWLSIPFAAPAASVTVAPAGPILIRSATAEFQIGPNGYCSAFLLKHGARLTLDDPAKEDSADGLQIDHLPVAHFAIDFARVEVSEAGAGGKRLSVPARAEAGGSVIERTTIFEIYDEFPGMLLSRVTYRNAGSHPFRLDAVRTVQHRINAHLTDAKASPFQLWSFDGASEKWGEDDVVAITQNFSRENRIGAALADGYGGGVPLMAFWTARAGLAIGHLDTQPVTARMPVKAGDDQRVRAGLIFDAGATLAPGETYALPQTFTMVYAGDYFEPLRTYSLAMQRHNWKVPQPNDADYDISWCGWGYEFNVTPAEMLSVVPKLKEYRIKWATLDDRWFDAYGDWNPRPDTFPGRSIEDMVRQYHKNGIYVQLWWLPIGAEIHGHKYESHGYSDSKVVREHPDWLVLDRSGQPAIMVRDLATLCPALSEVQQYYRRLTEKFIRDWDFDGHKLDNIFSVPPCYNPKHHHQSPYDSVNAMGEVYRIIFDTTRALKPNSVTQACPCGTPPNIAWLRYIDQAVTADPVGSAQVRHRVKMYKALFGPHAAVYGDHVELTEVTRRNGRKEDSGTDFASSIGTGAVVGTKFVWPQSGAKYEKVALNPGKDRLWRKWIDLYHAKMLSRGEFLNLYTVGYDAPEGYVVAKDGKMYYAFYTPYPDDSWKGEIELRGLAPGKHHVVDYANDKDMGAVDAAHPRLAAAFTGSLLLEVTKQ